MRALWLPDVLRGAGLTVVEHPGWQDRGKALRAIKGVVWHHTASGPGWSDDDVAALLIRGRSDLPGPLCQLGLRRSGVYDVIAAGRGNHNGYGEWGNDSIGIEAYNDGLGEPWPDVQLDAYDRGTAAILRHLGLAATQVKGHKETDPGRKVDPRNVDMYAARERVAALLAGHPTQSEEDTLTPAQEHKLDRLLASNTRIEEGQRRLARALTNVQGIAQTDLEAQLIDIAEQRAEFAQD